MSTEAHDLLMEIFGVALKSKIFAVPENWPRRNAYALQNRHVFPINKLDTTHSTPGL